MTKANMFEDQLSNKNNPSHIVPTKYTLDSKLKFRCHPGVSCFTACCGTIKIILTPFDILRLRKRLDMPADDFLLQYATPIYLERTDLPGVVIKLTDEGRCPFVRDDGCIVYSDRPTACRYYPVGMANFHERDEDKGRDEEFYFVIKEPHCKGFEEDKEWTIAEWRQDQGVDLCDQMNKEWMELVMRRKSFGPQASLSEPAKKMFFMASTNLDSFRSFVFESSFLETYIVEQEILDEIKTDDIKLMKFANRFMASALFGIDDLKIREEKVKARIEKMKEEQKESEKRAVAYYQELAEEREKMKKQTAPK